jgi:hypothetical protein
MTRPFLRNKTGVEREIISRTPSIIGVSCGMHWLHIYSIQKAENRDGVEGLKPAGIFMKVAEDRILGVDKS